MTEQGKVSRCTNIQVLKLFVIKITGKWYLFTPVFPGGLQDVETPYNVHCCWKLLVPFGHLKQLLFLLFSQVRLIIYLNVVSQCLFLFQEEKHSLGIPSGWPGALRWRRIAWLEAEPNGGCSLERCGTAEGWRSSICWVKGLSSHISVLVLSFPSAPSSATNYPWLGTCKVLTKSEVYRKYKWAQKWQQIA